MTTVRSKIEISAPPEQVWAFVADPILESGWNPKMVAIDREPVGPVRLGERFQIEYVMSGKSSRCEAEVLESHDPARLVYRYHLLDEKRPVSVLIAYDLEGHNGSTRLVQSIDLSGMDIPWPLRLLIWIITRCGTSVGLPYLERLKQQVEDIEAA